MTAYVTKPLRRGDLLAAIAKVLNTKPQSGAPHYMSDATQSTIDDVDRTLVLASR